MVIDCVVAPVDQTLPVVELDVRVILSPKHNVVAPLAEIVGLEGIGFTVTVIGAEATL